MPTSDIPQPQSPSTAPTSSTTPASTACCAKWQQRALMLEDELRTRNAECSRLQQEHRVYKSHSEALQRVQGHALRLEDQCNRLNAENAALRERIAALERERVKETFTALRRQLTCDEGSETAERKKKLSAEFPNANGDEEIRRNAAATLLPAANLKPHFSSIGFGPSTTLRDPFSGPLQSSSCNSGNGGCCNPRGSGNNDEGEADEVERVLRMASDAAALDIRHAEVQSSDDDELHRRFLALQQRR